MRKTAAILTNLCLVVGFVTSGTLLARTLSLLENVNAAGDICSLLFGQGCDPILLDSASNVAGLPLAGWGILYFGIYCFSCCWGSASTSLFIARHAC